MSLRSAAASPPLIALKMPTVSAKLASDYPLLRHQHRCGHLVQNGVGDTAEGSFT